MGISVSKVLFVLQAFIFLFCGTVKAESVLLPSAIVSIYDGDTFTVSFDGCPSVLCEKLSVRIDGIDAPEIRSHCESEKTGAIAAKKFLFEMIKNSRLVSLVNPQRDKYYRLRAAVFADGVDIGEEMLKRGLVRPYHGEKRLGWCGK